MKLTIETIAMEHESGFFAYAEAKVRAALAPLHGRLKAVHVQLEDVNGPGMGGVDKHCTVGIALHALGGRAFDEVPSGARAALELVAARTNMWARRRATDPVRVQRDICLKNAQQIANMRRTLEDLFSTTLSWFTSSQNEGLKLRPPFNNPFNLHVAQRERP